MLQSTLDPEVEQAFLRELYAVYLQGEQKFNYADYIRHTGADPNTICELVRTLMDRGLGGARYIGADIHLTGSGVLYCEREGLVDPDIVAAEGEARFKILDVLQKERDLHGPRRGLRGFQLPEETGLTDTETWRNHRVLEQMGLVGSYHIWVVITDAGTEQAETWRRQKRWFQAYQELATLEKCTAQQRGHHLENLLAELVAEEGWKVETQVRSQGQEHDLIVSQSFQYFFVSCKWEKKKTQPAVLELLDSRVQSRRGTTAGLLVSVAGFTDQCINEARFKVSGSLILLFGPGDVESLFCAKATFTDLVHAKYEAAFHHRKILVDGVAH